MPDSRAGAFAIYRLIHHGKKPVAADAPTSADHAKDQSKRPVREVINGRHWAAIQAERVPGMPMSAEFYDTVWKAVTVPKISGCLQIQSPKLSRCTCTTQQGTNITTITPEACAFYVKNGWFDPTLQEADAASPRKSSLPVASGSSVASISPGP